MKRVILPDKIAAPSLHSIILQRESLTKLFIDALWSSTSEQPSTYKLVLLCAPAGYGKTTLLADAIQRASLACCWCFLEPEDSAPAFFCQMLLASTQHCFPALAPFLHSISQEYGIEADTDASVELGQWENLIDALLDLLKTHISQRFVFALCQYQNVNQSADINHLLDYLLQGLPEQGTIILESRSMPDLELAFLIAQDQMFGIGEQKLRFSRQEIYALAHLQNNATLTSEAAEEIERFFQGWIAGIVLGGFLEHGYIPERPHARTKDQPTLFPPTGFKQLAAYIANEVFARERTIYTFLQETSVLTLLTPENCNTLLQSHDAEQPLLYAYQQRLFLISVETAPPHIPTFICHPVLREIFLANLCSMSFERYQNLERRAASLT